jgi:propionyl-CoA carboxylase alpha chain
MDQVISVARACGADAIHPGYGFLSENALFAQRVIDNGLVFIGPSPAAIRTMGSKLEAKAAAEKFNVPLVPGTTSPLKSTEEAKSLANKIGYPILIKASAGGGGKGMRVVESESELKEQMERATNEARSAFGDGSIFIEKYISRPKHIEFQILGDHHGNLVHLFERECSIQRRHQKVIEEAPSSILTEELREEMGQAAVQVARSVDYVGAGTVEFIVDENMKFYFLEMNTRLQVEHPVTEMITGLDLVRLQILIAEGHKLPFTQHQIPRLGHAIEVRVYAEDPNNNFLPDTGKLHTYRRPQGPGIRVDDGYDQGMEIPFYYDPMIAKLICHGESRIAAIEKTIRAIDEYQITGIATTLPFCKYALRHEAFVSGNFDTHFVEKYFRAPLTDEPVLDDETDKLAAALAVHLMNERRPEPKSTLTPGSNGQWKKRVKKRG